MDKADFLRDRGENDDNPFERTGYGSIQAPERLDYPEMWTGNINLRHLTSIEGLKLPRILNGNLDLGGLTHAEGLELPEEINGELDLVNLGSGKGIKWPKNVTVRTFLGKLNFEEKSKLRRENMGLMIK